MHNCAEERCTMRRDTDRDVRSAYLFGCSTPWGDVGVSFVSTKAKRVIDDAKVVEPEANDG